MTQIEQIKAEIEKRFNEYSTSILKHYDSYKECWRAAIEYCFKYLLK